MDESQARRLRRALRLCYPVSVVWCAPQWHGSLPDLPGCVAADVSLPALYARLEQLRRDWLTARVAGGAAAPRPNAALGPQQPG